MGGGKPKHDALNIKEPVGAEPKTPNAVLRMKLVKANRAAKVTGTDELPGKSNYFIGNDPKKWCSDVAEYAKVKYEGIYSGIDLVYYGNQRQLEYDFVVQPGADPRRIQFDVRGAKRIRRDKDGDLVLQMADGEVRWNKPVVYQEEDGRRQKVDGHYVIKHGKHVGFEVAAYDSKRALFIDPLIYSTYLGGSSAQDYGYGIAVDSSGNTYVTGYTASTDFPTANPLQASCGDGGSCTNGDAFVAKLNASGSALVYSTYLGGGSTEFGYGIAVDTAGNAYVTGYTASTDFPTANPLQVANGGGNDAFVAKLNASGSALIYSTYLGGSAQDYGYGITVDNSGNAYVTGLTTSTDFLTANPFQAANGGGNDAFVAKLNNTGSALVYSTYLGGSGGDSSQSIAVDASGNAYIVGQTSSADFPTMNPLQPANGGGSYDAFVAKFNPAGSALVYSTYLGGSEYDGGNGLAVDSSGDAYITGLTSSTDFPTMNPLQPANGGGSYDAFVAKFNPAGSALVYSTYLGGSGYEEGDGIAVDSVGNAYVIGSTASTDFPTMNPLQPTNRGGYDAFVAQMNPAGSALIYSTYLGGGGEDAGYGVAVDNSGNAYVTGFTCSTNFPTMNALQPANAGNCDAFVAKMARPSATVEFSPPNLSFGNQPVGITSAPQHSTLTNVGQLALTITSISVTGANRGNFAATNDCGTSVAAGNSCNITVTFTPSSIGTRTAAVSMIDNAPNSPQTIPLTGVGVLPTVKLSPTSLTFPDQTVFTTSKAQPVKLTNTGLGILEISKVAVTGAFAQTNNCGASVNPGGSCAFSVTFKPKTIGALNGSISITDNAPASPQTVTLKGTGTYVLLTPAAENFGTQPVGTTSLAKTITLSNKGSAAVNITKISITGLAPGDFSQTNTCGTKVAAGASCFIKVKTKPTAKGTRTAAVSVTDNGGGSPQKVGLVVTGT